MAASICLIRTLFNTLFKLNTLLPVEKVNEKGSQILSLINCVSNCLTINYSILNYIALIFTNLSWQ